VEKYTPLHINNITGMLWTKIKADSYPATKCYFEDLKKKEDI
jgi:hypothetical protein